MNRIYSKSKKLLGSRNNQPSNLPNETKESSAESPRSSWAEKRKQWIAADESTIGKYKVLRTIGKGNYARVKLAKHMVTKEKVAIKIIDKTKLSANRLSKLFREVEIMKMLNHPNIVKFFKAMETKETLYLIMEYAPGGDMGTYLYDQGRLEEEEARAKFRQIVSAVEYCHQRGIVHRDLKIDNILLDDKMNVKIADFGISNTISPESKLDSFCGTNAYLAPEVLFGKKYGTKVDVWSLGVTLYLLLTDRFPFDDSSLQQLKKEVQQINYRVPRYMSADCETLLKKMLVFKPSERADLEFVMCDKWLNKGYKKQLKPYEKKGKVK